MSLKKIREEIKIHPMNTHFLTKGCEPIYTASETAQLVIIGQAPGKKAQESGIPWNDVSGDNLRTWLGINRDTFYDTSRIALVPMDFYFPGKGAHGDVPPRKEFAPLWHPKIFSMMPQIKLTLLVGQYAQKYYLGDTAKQNLTETVRAFEEYLPRYFPLVHPSPLTARWQAKNKWFGKVVIPRLRSVVRKLL